MNIDILYFNDCPHWKIADERLAAIAAERSDITVTHHLVESVDEAERLGFHGSPSILIDGVDAFAEAAAGIGLSCRLYQTPEGPAGAPTVEQLRSAIAQA
jgi:glutaredoxin